MYMHGFHSTSVLTVPTFLPSLKFQFFMLCNMSTTREIPMPWFIITAPQQRKFFSYDSHDKGNSLAVGTEI